MEKRIAELQIELRKKDNQVYELKRELLIKDNIIHKQVVMLQKKDEELLNVRTDLQNLEYRLLKEDYEW